MPMATHATHRAKGIVTQQKTIQEGRAMFEMDTVNGKPIIAYRMRTPDGGAYYTRDLDRENILHRYRWDFLGLWHPPMTDQVVAYMHSPGLGKYQFSHLATDLPSPSTITPLRILLARNIIA